MRSDMAGRIKVAVGMLFALILMIAGMVLITRGQGG
jgi:hypothetical protein